MQRSTFALLAIAAVAIPALSGCFGGNNKDNDSGSVVDPNALTPVQERYLQPYLVDGFYSKTLAAGPYTMKDPISVFVSVDLPATEGGAVASVEGPRVHLGLFLPDVPEGTLVPVIADVGPYYGDSDKPAVDPKTGRLGGFLIDNFVPHGYAVAQVSVFGSGLSNHCMDLMGNAEQLGIDAAVTWLGTQEWSNGKVGLIGRSYDGSTPWEAATFGNEHLATIVPISGLIGMHELMWRNGTSETRGPIMHNVVYGTFGIDAPEPGSETMGAAGQLVENLQTLCPDYLSGPVEGVGAYATGDYVAPQANSYWIERSFLPRALANYKGSVYLIHGLQDWNVDPHMAFPTYQMLQAAGLETKGLFGQWNHMYPDRPGEHERSTSGRGEEGYPNSVRYDWAQDLLEWFDHYLNGTGPKPQLHVEVQDNHGTWRIESTYPPANLTWEVHGLDQADVTLSAIGGQTNVAQQPLVSPLHGMRLDFPPLVNETRIAGLAQFHVRVTPGGSGGQIFVEMQDVDDKGTALRLGHAIMDLRFAQGGNEMRPVVAGAPIVARMEFEALDAVVPAGHHLRLVVENTGEDYLPSSTSAPIVVDLTSASALRLPTVDSGALEFFTPPAWSGKASATPQQP